MVGSYSGESVDLNSDEAVVGVRNQRHDRGRQEDQPKLRRANRASEPPHKSRPAEAAKSQFMIDCARGPATHESRPAEAANRSAWSGQTADAQRVLPVGRRGWLTQTALRMPGEVLTSVLVREMMPASSTIGRSFSTVERRPCQECTVHIQIGDGGVALALAAGTEAFWWVLGWNIHRVLELGESPGALELGEDPRLGESSEDLELLNCARWTKRLRNVCRHKQREDQCRQLEPESCGCFHVGPAEGRHP